MPIHLTDAQLKDAMQAIARVAGLNLPADRIERDLPAYRSFLAALDAIYAVDLPLEAEPAPRVVLEPERRR